MKQFKAESKRVLDLMINSIYTNQEIFLRELISNASDAMDKLYVQSLNDDKISFDKSDLKIEIHVNKDLRTIHIKDYGIGMTKEELETNLGTIAHSDSGLLKQDLQPMSDVDIIGQFGVGFYSGYLVAKEMRVMTKSEKSDSGYAFISTGLEGYQINKVDKSDRGTEVILYLKDNTDEANYDQYLEFENIQSLVKKYSDYVRYPIVMDDQTLNSMIPLWKRSKKDVTTEELNNFYKDRFNDFEDPAHTIFMQVEGTLSFNALLFIPNRIPFNFYNPSNKKGLALYSRSVFIQEHNEALIEDYFGFVKGLVDSADLNLNISREVLQNDRQVSAMAKRINRKIKSELELLLKNDREKYEAIYKNFGVLLKYGVYDKFGAHKEELKDLLLFTSLKENKLVTLKEFSDNQDNLYYVSSSSVKAAKQLPQVEKLLDKDQDVLVLMDEIDEFALKMMMTYDDKPFKSINQGSLEIDEKEQSKLDELTTQNKSLLEMIHSNLEGKVSEVRLTSRLKSHPVCLVSDEGISFEMEKVMAQSPDASQRLKANRILEINPEHALFGKLKNLPKDELSLYSDLLYNQALLIEGLEIEDPMEFVSKMNQLMLNE